MQMRMVRLYQDKKKMRQAARNCNTVGIHWTPGQPLPMWQPFSHSEQNENVNGILQSHKGLRDGQAK